MCLVVWKKWCLEVRQKKLILLGELVKLKVQRMLFFSLLLLAREKKKLWRNFDLSCHEIRA